MNPGFYLKIAVTGIKKNKKLYYPYILAGSAMVMVYYIFNFLSFSQIVKTLPGREVLPVLFEYGSKMIAIFSIPFLFYTNASLIKKRKKELGLYNILGMNKKNLFHVLFFETLITYISVIIIGLILGIAFSKIAELGLVNIMAKEVNYHLYVEIKSVIRVILIFAFIYFLILLNSIRQIRKNNPIELLHSDVLGEKPPKSKTISTILSIIVIIASYIMISKLIMPLKYKTLTISVLLMVIGTFGIFISVSVFICNKLQKNKNYYYKTSHFVSISSMKYRMKRNAVSLAIICILVTFILSTLAFSASFYYGSIDTINNHYPYDIAVSIEIPTEKVKDEMKNRKYTLNLKENIDKITKNDKNIQKINLYTANMMTVIDNNTLDLSYDMRKTWFKPGYYETWEKGNQKIVYTHIISLKDYNRLCNTNYTLDKNQIILASETIDYKENEIKLPQNKQVKVKQKTKQIPKLTEVRIDKASLDTHGCEQIYIITENPYEFVGKEQGVQNYKKANYMVYNWQEDMKIQGNDKEKSQIYDQIQNYIQNSNYKNLDEDQLNYYLKANKSERFYALAGGLLFLAVIMNILFIFVTALIMYYKQISEGYEDQKRFNIMKKLGITKKEIKKSINSQMLLVFALPIIIGGIHFFMSSNLLYLMLKYAVIDNKTLLIKVMIAIYLIFILAYSIVYKLTSKTYYKIVNTPINR